MTTTTDDPVVKDATHLEGLAAELRSYITKSEDAPPETLRSLSCRALDDIAAGIRERDPELTKEAAFVKAMHQVPGDEGQEKPRKRPEAGNTRNGLGHVIGPCPTAL